MEVQVDHTQDDLMETLSAFPSIGLGIAILVLIVLLASICYIFSSIWLFQLAKQEKMRFPILAFIPIIKIYIVGYITNEKFINKGLPSQHVGGIALAFATMTTISLLFIDGATMFYPVMSTIVYSGFIYFIVKDKRFKWILFTILCIINLFPYGYIALYGIYKTKKHFIPKKTTS